MVDAVAKIEGISMSSASFKALVGKGVQILTILDEIKISGYNLEIHLAATFLALNGLANRLLTAFFPV